ncbi:uncharacterized protein K460DRAFT_408940 [Cucurbitaria berberidis CBS 394.84]|uniref:Uncharacterized protein n=1 Tax=Cucurbitaria berberidis CBS 394.84 TaxID=1168544 RepID=A0A9P4L3Z2_9PLEO|nr:uncharacterized protein K460DRAFT_408940 [Cucurbitaria berberidis CBS 394.84]KAF1841476.1 hypothetical protein K460DRAFT_408940 [Cucurbitaria berberidis CBS 394.84]
MSDRLDWICSTPNGSLGTVMEQLALQIAEQGEYDEVDILSTIKTKTGGRTAAPHFKVLLTGTVNGREVKHNYLIRVAHRSTNGQLS